MRRRDNELQADPQLVEGPASGTKVAMYAIAIAVVLGVVFYGLNNTTVDQAGTAPPSETAQQTQPANPAGPSGKTNSEPGTLVDQRVPITRAAGRYRFADATLALSELEIDLPRPRNRKEPEFYGWIDEIYSLIV